MRLLLALLVLLLAVPRVARAQPDGRLGFLSRQLTQAKDPRARAQAALMMGAMREEAAGTSLCRGLGDASGLVRIAVSKGLVQLGDAASLACLEAHAADPDPDARAEVSRAIQTLKGLQSHKPERYVALAPIRDASGDVGEAVSHYAEDQLRSLLQRGGSLVAPERETSSQAHAVLKARRLKGYQLRAQLASSPPSGLRISILCFTYPEQALLGEASVNASGAKPLELVRALIPRALEEAAQTCNWSP